MLATPELILEAAQIRKLMEMLPRWSQEVPLFRSIAGELNGPDFMAQFKQLPQITKREIREGFPNNFLGDREDLETLVDSGLVEVEHTSGTSEQRTRLILGLGWWAEQETRALRLNRVVAHVLDEYPNSRRATISSPVCSGDVCYTGVPPLSERIVGNTLYVSLSRQPFLWSNAEFDRIAREIIDWEPQFLDVDPVYGMLFALYCERTGIRLPSLRFVLCSYEFVSTVHRRILERVFGVPVFNLYGSTETGHLLMENHACQMVPSLETAYLEIVEADATGVGQLVVTTLTNDYMPLIRYRIGDLVERIELGCDTTYRVHGRAKDAFTTTEGIRVTTLQLDRCFEGLEGFAHYQMIQASSGWLLRYVPDRGGPTKHALLELHQRLECKLGASVAMQQLDAVTPETSGKFRLGYPAGS